MINIGEKHSANVYYYHPLIYVLCLQLFSNSFMGETLYEVMALIVFLHVSYFHILSICYHAAYTPYGRKEHRHKMRRNKTYYHQRTKLTRYYSHIDMRLGMFYLKGDIVKLLATAI